MTNFSDLIAYFENLARTHVDILHTDTKKHFFRFELDEILTGINRSDVAYPMLALEGYTCKFTDNNSDNILRNRDTAFTLMDNCPDISDYTKVHAIWDKLESIADDILIRMKIDKRNPLTPVIRSFDFSSVEVNLIANEIGNSIGVRVSFTVSSPVPSDVNPDKWISPDL